MSAKISKDLSTFLKILKFGTDKKPPVGAHGAIN